MDALRVMQPLASARGSDFAQSLGSAVLAAARRGRCDTIRYRWSRFTTSEVVLGLVREAELRGVASRAGRWRREHALELGEGGCRFVSCLRAAEEDLGERFDRVG